MRAASNVIFYVSKRNIWNLGCLPHFGSRRLRSHFNLDPSSSEDCLVEHSDTDRVVEYKEKSESWVVELSETIDWSKCTCLALTTG